MHPLYRKASELTQVAIASAIEVQKHFGVGLPESIYQKCLGQELRMRGHDAVTEVAVPIHYKGFTFTEKLRIDLLVDDCLVIEAKALDENKINMVAHKAQCLSYLKLMNLPLGLVINFGDYRLGKRGIARIILAGADAEGGDF